MATIVDHVWRPYDDLFLLAARYLEQSGYPDTSSLAEAIRAANPAITDWTALATAAPDTTPLTLTIPFRTT